MTNSNHIEWLSLKRNVRFGETDAAGVINFSQLLRWCHESWEESLEIYGVSSQSVFPGNYLNNDIPEIALPIIHCEADYFQPIYVGDKLDMRLFPRKIHFSSFLLQVDFYRTGDKVGRGVLKHLAINSKTRKRAALPKSIDLWLEASSTSLGINPV